MHRRSALLAALGEGRYRGAFALALRDRIGVDDLWLQACSGRWISGVSPWACDGFVRPLVAVLAYALIFYFHGRTFGAPLV